MKTESSGPVYDAAIIGAGAAGLTASIFCAKAGRRILLLDAKEKPAAKILISGGGRCNVTHRIVTERDYSAGQPRTVRNVLRHFPVEKTVEFFKTIGIELIEEEDGKLFPRTQRARTVREALLDEAAAAGVSLKVSHPVTSVRYTGGCFHIYGEAFEYEAKTAVLCTGGLSYPETGSDGSGYHLARQFGHTVTETTPALAPLVSEDPSWTELTGISLPCRLTLWAAGKKIATSEGAILFTHTGFSGPCVLDISRHWVRATHTPGAELTADFIPDFDEQAFRHILNRASREEPGCTLKNFLSEKLPERLIEVLCAKIAVSEGTVLNQFKKQDRERLIRVIYRCPLPVREIGGYDKAEATAGGVSLGEVDPHTLESKIQKGLFFAGEILDVDGRIGGFNLQWAWSSAAAAAAGVLKGA